MAATLKDRVLAASPCALVTGFRTVPTPSYSSMAWRAESLSQGHAGLAATSENSTGSQVITWQQGLARRELSVRDSLALAAMFGDRMGSRTGS